MKNNTMKDRARLVGLICLSLILVLLLSFVSYTLAYTNRIYPNVFISGEKFGGLKQAQAREKLNSKLTSYQFDKIIFEFGTQRWELDPKTIGFQYNLETTFGEVWQIGRKAGLFDSLKEQILALFKPHYLYAHIEYSPEDLNKQIEKMAKEIDVPMQTISFVLKNGEIEMVPAKSGQRLNKEKTIANFENAMRNFQNNIKIVVDQLEPRVKEADDTSKAKEVFAKMVSDDLVLKWQDKKFVVKPQDIQKWIEFVEEEEEGSWKLVARLSEEKIRSYLKSIAKEIDKDPIDARLTLSDGKVTVFQQHQDGYSLDIETSLKDIQKVLENTTSNDLREVDLTVVVKKANIREDTIEQLGIHDLIGEGTSNFKGSPKNRIHNIIVGANLFHGVLIKPGEVFSFNQILGEVSAKKGFLPELVIKEDRLIPETGGGLCQVSTTMFRAAVYSGLDILERTPHSFRVRYYEPPVGLDATVYIPKPDLKFKNDTPGYILIQTKIEGYNLTFQFYGTKDGRTVEIKGPYTSNYRSPGSPVYINDPSLPAGQIKQIERGVPGLTATIYWTVYKDGKVLHKKTFVSKYVAWRAKYKKGTGPAPVSQ